jgi:hypothetical protein
MAQLKDGRRRPFFWIDNRVLPMIAQMSLGALKVYLCIAYHTSGRKRSAFVSYKRMADELGLDKRTVIDGIRRLVELGRLRVEARTIRSGWKAANLYELLDPPEGAAGGRAQGAQDGDPDGTSAARPDGTSAARPDGTSAARPDGTSAARPDGTSAARSHQMHEQDPVEQDPVEQDPVSSKAAAEPQAQAPPAAAAAAAEDFQAEEQTAAAASALEQLGIGRDLAARYARQDATLALAAVPHLEDRLTDPKRDPIRNPVGFIRALFKDPVRFGFSRDPADRWLPPPAALMPRRRPPAERVDPALEHYRQRRLRRTATACGTAEGGTR